MKAVGIVVGVTAALAIQTTLARFIKMGRYEYPSSAVTAKMGAMAVKLSREWGRDVGQIPDAKYGKINTYDPDVAQTVTQAFRLRKRGELVAS